MITFHSDPNIAEQQMLAVIFYLTAFGYIDGNFDKSEKSYVRDYVGKLVVGRARAILGEKLDQHYADIERTINHFHLVIDETQRQIEELFTESVAEGESSEQFVLAKPKLRCFELFRRFDDKTRSQLLASVDDLMLADGTTHPNEEAFRRELYKLLFVPVEVEDYDLAEVEPASEELSDADLAEVEPGAVIISTPKTLSPSLPDHPFFREFEYPYAKDKESFLVQAKADMELIDRVVATLEKQRAAGKGLLDTLSDFSSAAPGTRFLDGHVYADKPAQGERCELLVVGDLHGCYSCLKGALLQADFFAKLSAYKSDPTQHPRPMVVLLGDYIDRGRFSYNGVLRTAMQLFVSEPDHVRMLRGNHEYYVEINGRVLAPVRPCEAMNEIKDVAPTEVFARYMRLFEELPTAYAFDKTLFVHAGIPRDDTLAEKYTGLSSLNDPEIRFQMLWSDPSDADAIPIDLQKANARFPFGRKQLKHFLNKLGVSTLVRGHESVAEGFRLVYDDPEAKLITLFSAGGATNEDLPPEAAYRKVTPMALTIRHEGGVSEVAPFAIDYARYNDPQYNAFFRDALTESK
ncbi:MAG: metallophosphoesterase [Polyangiaceae bacterium]|nr:metallophosphoesterase [Polyangiaceae bacterium]